jgi:hypothetical protein
LFGGLPIWADAQGGGSGNLPPGGITNQYLIKQSATDFDATWATLNWADITDVTPTLAEINRVDGVTSPIQTQLNGKQATLTGATTTVTSSNLASNRVVVSNGSGKLAPSPITTTELNQLDGINTGQTIQAQINGKQNTITGAASTVTASNLTSNRMVYSNGSGKIGASNVGYTDANDYMTYTIQYGTSTTVNARIPSEKWVTDNYKVTEGSGAPAPGAAKSFGIHLYIDTNS